MDGHRTQHVQSPAEVESEEEHVYVTILHPQMVEIIAWETTQNILIALHHLAVCLSNYCHNDCIVFEEEIVHKAFDESFVTIFNHKVHGFKQ